MWKKFRLLAVFLVIILSQTLISCKGISKPERMYLTDSLYYYSADRSSNIASIKFIDNAQRTVFTKLDPQDFDHLSRYTDYESYIWIKAVFEIPDNLRNEDLGLNIPYLKTCSECYLNGNLVGSYGSFPPNEFSPGYISHYFLLPQTLLNTHGENTIYLKIWAGGSGAISKNLYISEASHAQFHSTVLTFFNSKIILIFSGAMFLSFVFYFLMFLVLKKVKRHQEHIVFALLNFYTIHFLLMFFASDIPFLTSSVISYLTFLKFTFFFGAFSTIYFANSFILSFLQIRQSDKIMIIRTAIFAVGVLPAMFAPSYKSLSYLLIPSFFLTLAQFGFTIPKIIEHLKNKETRANAKKLFKGFSPVLCCIPVDFIMRIGFTYRDWPYLTIYGWQITVITFTAFLVKQFTNLYLNNIKLTDQLADFNSHLENQVAERTKEISEKNLILTEGLHAVSNVQKNFLPPKKRTFRGWELAISYKPLVNEVSGDLYDYYYTGENLDGIGIFDVSGHGIPSGLMTILAKGIISQHFLSGITQSEPISQVLEKINKTYIKEKVNVENYITGLLFRFSSFNKKDTCSVEVANAGHPHPYLYKADTGEIEEIQYEDPRMQYGMIGLSDLPVSFPPVSFRMKPNDIIVCFTDGLTDSSNLQNEDFGKERLKEIIRQNAKESALTIRNKINEALSDFTQDKAPNDDITFIILKRNNSKDYIEELPDTEWII